MPGFLIETERTSTTHNISWRVLPCLMLCYLAAYFDRSNTSIATLTMNADLGLTTAMCGLAVGLFFVSCTIFEIPSNAGVLMIASAWAVGRLFGLTLGLKRQPAAALLAIPAVRS